jgi:hypothetical protein
MSSQPAIRPHEYKVGQDVSYGFNGDWYHAGVVEKFSPSGKYMHTSRGDKFVKVVRLLRVQDGDRWSDRHCEVFQSLRGGTWSVCPGIHEEQNPHF